MLIERVLRHKRADRNQPYIYGNRAGAEADNALRAARRHRHGRGRYIQHRRQDLRRPLRRPVGARGDNGLLPADAYDDCLRAAHLHRRLVARFDSIRREARR